MLEKETEDLIKINVIILNLQNPNFVGFFEIFKIFLKKYKKNLMY